MYLLTADTIKSLRERVEVAKPQDDIAKRKYVIGITAGMRGAGVGASYLVETIDALVAV